MKKYKQIDCFNSMIKFWIFLGIWNVKTSGPMYKYYSKTFIFVFTIMYDLLCTINLYFLPRHIENFIEELTFYFTELAAMSKVFTILLRNYKIKEILDTLESDMFQPKTTNTINIVENAKKFNLLYWKVFFGVSFTANVFHVSIPLIAHIIFKNELILPVSSFSFLSDSVKEAYIYPLYLYQSVGMHFIMLYDVNIDTFIVGLMNYVIAQLKILEENLSTITEDILLENKNPVPMKNKSCANEEAIILKLKKALIHYGEVTKLCIQIEDVFSFSLFAQFSMSSSILCIVLFRFTMSPPWHYYVFLGTYMYAMICQTLGPSWFGTRIIDQSCRLSQALYRCDWTPRSKQFKSSMRLFIERANRPLTITGLKMFPLALTTFTSIMNSAYTFYTLLRQVQSR